MDILGMFQCQYPHRAIKLTYNERTGNEYVSIDGLEVFCISGFNLLRNVTMLCEALKDELR